jgi:DNA-binding PadR family transcriptional regulator
VALPPPVFHILIALADQERHGYAIMQDVAARTGGSLKMSPGTLYGSIKRMLEEGLIDEIEERPAFGDDDRRRYYRITSTGRHVASQEMERLTDILKQARATSLRPSES